MGFQAGVIKPCQPGILVGRKNAIRRSRFGQYFAAFENDVILDGLKRNTVVRQGLPGFGIPCDGLRFVVAGCKYHLGV